MRIRIHDSRAAALRAAKRTLAKLSRLGLSPALDERPDEFILCGSPSSPELEFPFRPELEFRAEMSSRFCGPAAPEVHPC